MNRVLNGPTAAATATEPTRVEVEAGALACVRCRVGS
jgi:hypothetical protein